MAFQAISDPPQCCLSVPLDLFQVSSTSLKHFLERLPRAASTGGQINTIKSKTQALLAPSAGRKVENPCQELPELSRSLTAKRINPGTAKPQVFSCSKNKRNSRK